MATRLRYQQPYLILFPVVLMVAVLVTVFWEYTQDDVFITYVYSRNIAEGVGFVFNAGEHVQGTTTPLWTLVMSGVYFITHDLLHAGNLLGGVSLILTCFVIYKFLQRYLSINAIAAIGLILASSPLVYVSLGMETLFYGLILVCAFWLWAEDRRALAVGVAAALTWTRADGIVLAGTFGLLILWEIIKGEGRFIDGAKLGAIYALGILPWFIFAQLYFGAPLPNTFNAKEEIFSGVKFLTEAANFWESFYRNNPLTLLATLLVPLGSWRLWLSPELRPLPLWAILYLAGYTVLNVTNFWYYTPLLIIIVILAVSGADYAAKQLIQRRNLRWATLVGSGAILSAIVILGLIRARDFGDPPRRTQAYRLVGEWINANTSEDATLTLGDLGIVGYYARRQLSDSPGLIAPDMYIKTPAYAVMKYKDDFVAAPQLFWNEITETEWFRSLYTPIAQISVKDDYQFSPIRIFQRRLDIQPHDWVIEGFDLSLTCVAELPQGASVPETTSAQLFTSDGELVVEVERPFLMGVYPDTIVRHDETLVEQIALPAIVEPGNYTWSMNCGAETLQGETTVMPFESAYEFDPMNARWGDFAELQGMSLADGNEVWSGGTLRVALQFVAAGTAETDYVLFTHLLDSSGNIVAQVDGAPRQGTRPPNTWETGETIIDVREIALPPDLAEGTYLLITGWYDWRTGERLLNDNGADFVVLPVEVHNRFPGGSGLP